MLDLEAQLEDLGIMTLVTSQLPTSARVQNVMKEGGGDCLSLLVQIQMVGLPLSSDFT